jgi:hypothetical protein
VALRVDFSKMAAVAMEMAKMLKKMKNTKMIIAGYSQNRNCHGNGCHFEFVQPLKSCHTLRWIFLQSFMKFDERNPNFFEIPLFCFQKNR